MIQLPATAAIEYVAACWVSGGIFVRGCFCPGSLLPGGHFPGGHLFPVAFARGHFWPGEGHLAGGFLSGCAFVRGEVICPGSFAQGTFVRGAYVRPPPPSSMRIRTV